MDYIDLPACHISLKMPWSLPAHYGSRFCSRELVICLCILEWYCDLLRVYRRAHRTCPQSLRLTPLNDADVTLRLKKSKFFTESIDYLGHMILPRSLEIASHTTDTIRGLQPSTNVPDLRSFLRLKTVFRCIVPNFARIVAPLNRKLCRDQPPIFGTLSKDDLNSLNTLKDALIAPPVLALPNSTGHMTLDTNACDVQAGCIFLQQQSDETTKRIGYEPRYLKDVERTYDTTEKGMSRNNVFSITSTTVSRSIQVYNTDWPWTVNVHSQPYRHHRSTRTLAPPTVRVWVRCCPPSGDKRPGRWCTLPTPYIEWGYNATVQQHIFVGIRDSGKATDVTIKAVYCKCRIGLSD